MKPTQATQNKRHSVVIDYIMNRHVHEMSSLFVMKKFDDDSGMFFSNPVHIRRILLKCKQSNTSIPPLSNDEWPYIHRVNITATEVASKFERYFHDISRLNVLNFLSDQLSHLSRDSIVGKRIFSKRIKILDDATMILLQTGTHSAADLEIVLDLYMEDSEGGDYLPTDVVADTLSARETSQRKLRNAHRTEGEGLRTSHKNPVDHPATWKRLDRSAQPKSSAVAAAAAGGGVRWGGSSDASPLSGRPAYTTDWLHDDQSEYSIFYHYQDPVVRMACEYVVMTLVEYSSVQGLLFETSVEEWFEKLVEEEGSKYCSYGKGEVNCCTKVLLTWLKQNTGIHDALLSSLKDAPQYQQMLRESDYGQFTDMSKVPKYRSLFADPQLQTPPFANLRNTNPLLSLVFYLQQVIDKIVAKSGRDENYPPISIWEVLDTTNEIWIIRCERFHLGRSPCVHHGLNGPDVSDQLLEILGLPSSQYASHVAIHTIAHSMDRLYCGHTHKYTEAGTKDQIWGHILGSMGFFATCKNQLKPKTNAGDSWTAVELWQMVNGVDGPFKENYGYDDKGSVSVECSVIKREYGCNMSARPASLKAYDQTAADDARQERRTARGYYQQYGEASIGDRCVVHEGKPPLCLLKNRENVAYWTPYDADYKYPLGCEKSNTCTDPCEKNGDSEVANKQHEQAAYIEKCKEFTFKR